MVDVPVESELRPVVTGPPEGDLRVSRLQQLGRREDQHSSVQVGPQRHRPVTLDVPCVQSTTPVGVLTWTCDWCVT